MAFERAADEKHELWDGQAYPMGGASLAHNRIVGIAIYHDEALVQRFLDAGADVNVKCWKGRTPLHIAASANGVELGVLRRLLDAGADLDALDELGRTPLDLAHTADTRGLLEQTRG